MYIGYDVKGGVKYAKICKSERIDGKVKTTQVSLGRVIDEKVGIYRSRERGVFTYDIATGAFGPPPSSAVIPVTKRKNARERLILDFGDAFFVDRYIKRIGMEAAIDAIKYGNHDSVRALVLFYVICSTANYNAAEWFAGTYARMLYPKANLESQRISELLSSVGKESSCRAFFREYSRLLAHRAEGEDVLIDSTGLPNSIHFPLTAVSNHNGQLSNEIRLIYVVQQKTNLPLYFRYVAGNIVDVSTLTKTILELKALGIDTKFAILDAGYLTDENAEEMYEAGISFVTRMRENRKLYKAIIAEHLPSLRDEGNLVSYNTRYAYIKRIECELVPGRRAYAYLGLDLSMRSLQSSKLFARAARGHMSGAQVHREMQAQGLFVLLSTRPIAKDGILPLYYTRQQIEQVFDVCKNNTNLMPLRVQSEDTLRGHLLLAFTASAIIKKLQEDLRETEHTPENALLALRNHKCKVFDGYVLTMEAAKCANDIYKAFKLKVEHTYSTG
ncbi:MAG: transposase [Deltaproteobacteria bacterium]|nr:transposase [Deltaproteobacteria bacterium]